MRTLVQAGLATLTICICALPGAPQALGDIARQQRMHLTARLPQHVITNDELSPRAVTPADPEKTNSPGSEIAAYYSPYKDWCDEPDKLQADLDKTQKELEVERATLSSMQEEARQQGFGNSVYDPD